MLNNPVPPSLRQATSSNPDPPPASLLLGPLASAPGSGAPLRPSGSGGEQDELMRAIALSLGENITDATSSTSTSETNSAASKPAPQPEPEVEEDDLPDEEYEPLTTTVIDDFAANALTGCLSLLDSLPDTVYR